MLFKKKTFKGIFGHKKGDLFEKESLSVLQGGWGWDSCEWQVQLSLGLKHRGNFLMSGFLIQT